MAIDEGLSVRQLEEWMRAEPASAGDATFERESDKVRAASAGKDADTRALERRLSDVLGLSVSRRPQRGERRHAAYQVQGFGSARRGVEEAGGLRALL